MVSTTPTDPSLPLYFDPDANPEKRIDALLSVMTLDEKIGCLGTRPEIPRLGIKATDHVEGLHGLALGGPGRWGGDRPIPTTTFPQAIGLACTWDPECVREVARIEGYEARFLFQSPKYQRGGLVVRAPNADLGRDPRWGRTEECFGEDAHLTATLSVAFVQGLQGEHPRYFMTAALLKHFLANSNEDERESSSSDFDERLFREYYSHPFRKAIEEGGARAFMAAYNKYNGVPCAVHPVLSRVAVREWGQDGIICTDGGAYGLLVTAHRHYETQEEAASATVRAGITQYLDHYVDGVKGALDKGSLTEGDLDRALRRNFRVMIRLGLWDPPERVPYAQIGYEPVDPWDRPEHQEAVRRVTQKSIVLLKNDNELLPLNPDVLDSIAVIGPLADRVLTDWYSGTLPYSVSCVDGLRERLGRGRVVLVSNNDTSAAILAAKRCAVALVCVGNHPTGDDGWAKVTRDSYGKEAVDRKTLTLEDEELVRRVQQANPNTILLLVSSFPYAIEWSVANVPAILHVTHNSQELGRAVADVLFGDYNPAGRLVQTWPRSVDDLAPMLDYDLRHGRTYQYSDKAPLFPFGYGKSYTTFTYSRLLTSSDRLAEGESLKVSVSISNIGRYDGDEVVQAYVRFVESAVVRPRKLLVGFRRINVPAGKTRTVEMAIAAEQLAFWHQRKQKFVLESGSVELLIGRSSAEIELTTAIAIEGLSGVAWASSRPPRSTVPPGDAAPNSARPSKPPIA
jgi:beta-glucosidase